MTLLTREVYINMNYITYHISWLFSLNTLTITEGKQTINDTTIERIFIYKHQCSRETESPRIRR